MLFLNAPADSFGLWFSPYANLAYIYNKSQWTPITMPNRGWRTRSCLKCMAFPTTESSTSTSSKSPGKVLSNDRTYSCPRPYSSEDSNSPSRLKIPMRKVWWSSHVTCLCSSKYQKRQTKPMGRMLGDLIQGLNGNWEKWWSGICSFSKKWPRRKSNRDEPWFLDSHLTIIWLITY